MYSLFRSLDTGHGDGTPLPSVWSTLANAGIDFYQGDVNMIAGPPGTGKSVLALNLALKCKVPTLYISCDMGPTLTAVRSAAILTGRPIDELRVSMESEEGRRTYRELLSSRVENLYMAHESRPSPEHIQSLGLAFGELWGQPPALTVIDNMMNLFSGNDNEWTGLRELSQVLHYFAHEWGSTVLALHHVNLGGIDPTVPAPLGALKGQISELPGVVVHLAKAAGKLRLCAVKNRHGRSDVSGRSYVSLDFNEECAILTDPVPQVPSYVPTSWAQEDWFARGVPE